MDTKNQGATTHFRALFWAEIEFERGPRLNYVFHLIVWQCLGLLVFFGIGFGFGLR